jgi:hypothetical protein
VPPSLSPPHLLLHLPNLYVRFRPFPLCPFPSTAGLVSPVHSLVPGPDVFSPSTLAAARRTKIRPCTTGLCATTEGAILRTNPAHCGAVCSSATDSPLTTALKPSRRPRKPPERPRRSRICNCCSHLLPSDRTKVGFRLSTLGSPATLLSRPARKWRSPVHDRTTASARLVLAHLGLPLDRRRSPSFLSQQLLAQSSLDFRYPLLLLLLLLARPLHTGRNADSSLSEQASPSLAVSARHQVQPAPARNTPASPCGIGPRQPRLPVAKPLTRPHRPSIRLPTTTDALDRFPTSWP